MTVTIDESSTRTLTVPPEAWNTPAPRKRGKKPLISYGHWWWALPAIVLVIAIHYVATLTGGFFAFTNWTGIGDWSFIGLDNFERIFKDPADARRGLEHAVPRVRLGDPHATSSACSSPSRSTAC